jgi:hypothetical protein
MFIRIGNRTFNTANVQHIFSGVDKVHGPFVGVRFVSSKPFDDEPDLAFFGAEAAALDDYLNEAAFGFRWRNNSRDRLDFIDLTPAESVQASGESASMST